MKKWLFHFSCLAILGLSGCAGQEAPLEPIFATVEIQVPCTDPLHIQPPEEPEDESPFLIADPQCGTLAEFDREAGTVVVIHAVGFYPNTETALLWEDSLGNIFRHRQLGEYVKPVSDQEGEFSIPILMPDRLLPEDSDGEYVVWKLTAFQGEPVEEEEPLEWDLVIEHLSISLVGSVIGIGSGIAVALLLVKSQQKLIRSKPHLLAVGFFIPWRTLLVSLLMHLIYPVVLIVQFGFGPKSGIIGTSAAMFLLTVIFCSSLLLWKWQDMSLAAQIRSAIRTLAVLSVLIATCLGFFGMGGLGPLLSVHIRLLEYDLALRYYLLLVGMVALVDLLGGVVAYILDRRETHSSSENKI